MFSPPSISLAAGESATSAVVLDWTAGPYGNNDFKIQASRGDFRVTNSMFPYKLDPSGPPPPPRDYGPDDYADEPHITMACDPPPSAPMALVQGQSIDITCTVGSALGFSDPVLVECLGAMSGVGLQCAGSTTVTPPPNGSVTVVLTLTVPAGYQPPGDGNNNVAIIASRTMVFTDPGRLDYQPTIPRLP